MEENICPECKGLRGEHSNMLCSLMTLDYAQNKIIEVNQEWIKRTVGMGADWQKDFCRLKKKIDYWQSKFHVVKNENNKLRKK